MKNGMFPCAFFGLRLGLLLLRVWTTQGGTCTAVLTMLYDLSEAACERTGLWRGDLAGGMK
jgi:hypothetical protein